MSALPRVMVVYRPEQESVSVNLVMAEAQELGSAIQSNVSKGGPAIFSNLSSCIFVSASGPTGTEGLKHEGCYRVVAGYGLYLLEHRFDYLKDNPFQRTQAVEKCARAASTLTYSVMAVAAGYCISGNDRLSDYTQFAGNGCQDGRGAYGSGSFYMDVYTITDPKAFLPQTPNDPNADIAQDDPSTDDEQLTTPSSSLMTRTSSVTAVCITMLAILFSNI